jgi:hypothetical protein
MGNFFTYLTIYGHPNSGTDSSTAIDHICGPTTSGGSGRKRRTSGNDAQSDVASKRFKLNTLDYVYQKV